MVIDFHGHIEDDMGFVDELLRRMDFYHIEKLVLFNPINRATQKIVNMHPDRFEGFVVVNPLYQDALETLKRFLGEGFRGVKMNPTGNWPQPYYPNDPAAYPAYELIASYGVPLLYHTGIIYRNPQNPAATKVKYCMPIHFDDVARDIPDLTLILAHGGRPFIEQTLSLCVCPNVMIDISWSQLPVYFYRRMVKDLLMAFGPDRLIYGSDVNINRPSAISENFVHAKTILDNLQIDASSIQKIMGDNAAALLGIKKPPVKACYTMAERPDTNVAGGFCPF